MPRLTKFALILLLPLVVRAEHAATPNTLASAAYQAKDFARSARLNEDAIKAVAPPHVPAYNATGCYALTGQADEAFTWLDKSLDAAYLAPIPLGGKTRRRASHGIVSHSSMSEFV